MSADIRATVDEWYELPEGAIYVRYPALLSAVEKVLEMHTPVDIEPSDTICHECSWQLPNGRYFGKVVEWPCPTVQAIQGALGGVNHD